MIEHLKWVTLRNDNIHWVHSSFDDLRLDSWWHGHQKCKTIYCYHSRVLCSRIPILIGQNQEQMLFRTQAYTSVRSLFCFQTVRLACLKHYFRDIFQIAHHSSRHWGLHFHSSFSNLDQLSKLKLNGKLHFLDKFFCNQVQILFMNLTYMYMIVHPTLWVC